jgi:hypothetical protein
MNRDDINKLIQEHGLFHGTMALGVVMDAEHLERFANLVAAAEREACADIAENWRCNGMPRYGVAFAIRERGAP